MKEEYMKYRGIEWYGMDGSTKVWRGKVEWKNQLAVNTTCHASWSSGSKYKFYFDRYTIKKVCDIYLEKFQSLEEWRTNKWNLVLGYFFQEWHMRIGLEICQIQRRNSCGVRCVECVSVWSMCVRGCVRVDICVYAALRSLKLSDNRGRSWATNWTELK